MVDEGITHVVVMDASPVFAQFLLATEGLNVPILLSEHFEPSRSAMQLKDPSLREKILSLADGIHFLLPSYSASKPKSFNGRSFVIENSVGKPERLANVTVSNRNGRFSLINVARLHFWQKRQDVLVKAFARIADKHPMWDLKLWGDVHNKKDYDKLSNLVSDSGLTSRVFFGKSLGHSELLEEIQNSHLFVIPSDFEGSPISLAEALVHGLPAVGFSECPGVNEVIRHGYNGFLALGLGDPKSLSECLDILIRSTRLRSEFSANAATLSDVRAPSKIMSDWETLLAWFTSTKKPLRNSHPDAKRILLSTKQELLPD
ncbi:hypothetical protein B0E33_04280 [Roseibium algicola]|uniref:Glycosyl transferase family 1 domain-containing protein n=1 Tax=Roseibium algicola TaxID=2857014 RepID=A0ABN4WS38_9HYPH|nr:hypothetical protein B0E33_04280 [Roseibium aggregatum]